jgi:predicted acylesterase/phospholipase RssA
LAAPARPTATGVSAVALVPVGTDAPVAPVARALAAALAAWGPTVHLSAATVDQRLGAGVADADRSDQRYPELTRWLDDQERHHAYVVYQGDGRDAEWTRRTLRLADVVLEVAAAGRRPPATPGADAPRGGAARELVLVQDATTGVPAGTAAWLAARAVRRHHHVRLGRIEDVSRLARRLTGRAVGVALSGGGARGFAHIGALKAIEEAGIPVDEIGGTSMGAVLAAQYATGHSVDDMAALNRELWRRYKPHKAYTLPYASIVTERAAQRMLERMFGTASLEDSWIECFCCATNITRAELAVQRRGPLAHALLASIAIPGVAPPIVGPGGELLVDGGVLDNVPAAHLHGGTGGAVIACDVSPDEDIRADASYVTNPSQWRVVANLLNPFSRTRYFPSIFEVLTRAAVVASMREARRVRESADLYLRPAVGGYGIFAFERIDELIAAGYAHAAAPARAWWAKQAHAAGDRRTTGVMI